MYKRTYFSKDNLIIKNSEINLGLKGVANLQNISDISYTSRYLFFFDLNELVNIHLNCNVLNLKHILNFYCTGNQFSCSPYFDLEFFVINQEWDEGCGVYEDCNHKCNEYSVNDCFTTNSPSNWYYANENLWGTDGVYVSGTTIGYLNFGCGINLLKFDITDFIQQNILNNSINNIKGIGIKFRDETLNQNLEIYTRQTETFFEPFVETTYESTIRDDRYFFYLNENKTLILNKNLDNIPNLTIKNIDGDIIKTVSVSCCGDNLYCGTFSLTESNECDFFYDEWSNLVSNSVALPNIVNKFYVKEKINIDNEIVEIKYLNIKNNDYIERVSNEIIVSLTEKFKKNTIKINKIFFKISKKDLAYTEDITNWIEFDYSNCEYYKNFDFSWLKKSEYYISFLIKDENNQEKYFNYFRKFNIK